MQKQSKEAWLKGIRQEILVNHPRNPIRIGQYLFIPNLENYLDVECRDILCIENKKIVKPKVDRLILLSKIKSK